jgi:hypothetical protein
MRPFPLGTPKHPFAGRAGIEPVGFSLVDPGFGETERLHDSFFCPEKSEVFPPAFFSIAGKHAEEAKKHQDHSQGTHNRPLDEYRHKAKN